MTKRESARERELERERENKDIPLTINQLITSMVIKNFYFDVFLIRITFNKLYIFFHCTT